MNLNELAREIHEINKSKGFWEKDRNVGEILALIHSEVSEALEAWRDGKTSNSWTYLWHTGLGSKKPDLTGVSIESMNGDVYFVSDVTGNRVKMTHDMYVKLGYVAKPEGLPSELADVIIRVLDFCAAWNIDIEEVLKQKVRYNATREYKHGRVQ